MGFLVQKFNPNHDPKNGRFTTGKGGSGGSKQSGYQRGVLHTSDVNAAAKALAEGRKVVLKHPKQVSTLLKKLATIVRDMEAKGEKAPNYNLCNVSVKGTNLFCTESKGIPRVEMPQLKGHPVKGSKADALPRDVRGEVDISAQFREHLEKRGIKIADDTERADFLKATQNELNGAKVAGIAGAIRENKLADERLFISRDNYVVDGHHRWAATVGVDLDDGRPGDLKMKVARVDMDIITLLDESNRFAADWGLPQVSVRKSVGCTNCPVNYYHILKYNKWHDIKGWFTFSGQGKAFAPPPPIRRSKDPAINKLRNQDSESQQRWAQKLGSKEYVELIDAIDIVHEHQKANLSEFDKGITQKQLMERISTKSVLNAFSRFSQKIRDKWAELSDAERMMFVEHVVAKMDLVHKYNKWHDPKNGRFAGKGAGRTDRKTLVTPTGRNAKRREKLTEYMKGYWSRLKNPSEKRYVAARCKQMINGVSRPSGMSKKYGLSKDRVIRLEIVTAKIFQSGRSKINV